MIPHSSHSITKRYLDVLSQRMGVGPYQKTETAQPLENLLEDLLELDDLSWSKYAFSHEALREKVTTDGKLRLYQKAVVCGEKWAESCIETYGVHTPISLACSLDIEVDKPDMQPRAGRILFAEYAVPNVIHIYREGVQKGTKLLSNPSVSNKLGDSLSIADILLGHELFHVVSYNHPDEVWTRTYMLSGYHCGVIPFHVHLPCLEEIAAMAFTRRLNTISWNPYALDVLLTYGYSPVAATNLCEAMIKVL